MFNPVKWTQTIEFLGSNKENAFLEIGPGKVLTSLGRRINKELNHISIDSMDAVENLLIN
jgi:[acyl-carrier-protein] S-malonyltransferase